MELKTSEHINYFVRNGTDEAFASEILVEKQYAIPEAPPPGSVFVDVGAYAGIWACQQLQSVQNSKVIAVEVLPENCALIAENLLLNHFDPERWTIWHNAVGTGKSMSITHCVAANHFIGASKSYVDYGSSIEVNVVTLGDLLCEVKRRWNADNIFAIKTDCEGGEYGFINSCTEEQMRHVKWLVGEYHNGVADHYELDPRMKGLGFRRIVGPWDEKALFKYQNQFISS